MHRSPLILDFYFVKKVQFELKEGFDDNFNCELQGVESPKITVDIKSGQHTENPLAWRFEISVATDKKASEKDFPYIFGVTIVGFFRVDENYPAENAEMLATVNAPSVLYSCAREFLANVTGRSPYAAILLPSVSFVPEPKKKKKENVQPVKKIKRIATSSKTKSE